MEVHSLKNNILVKILPYGERKYKELIIIPAGVKRTDTYYYGIVDSVGSGFKTKKGAVKPCTVSLGDVIIFPRHTGVRLSIDDVEYRYIKESEIIAVIEE